MNFKERNCSSNKQFKCSGAHEHNQDHTFHPCRDIFRLVQVKIFTILKLHLLISLILLVACAKPPSNSIPLSDVTANYLIITSSGSSWVSCFVHFTRRDNSTEAFTLEHNDLLTCNGEPMQTTNGSYFYGWSTYDPSFTVSSSQPTNTTSNTNTENGDADTGTQSVQLILIRQGISTLIAQRNPFSIWDIRNFDNN